MIVRNKKRFYLFTLALLFISAFFYFSWVEYRPVKVISVHQRNNYSDVLVRNFPITDNEKIAWWLKEKEMLKANYNIPKPAPDGFFSVTFWVFDGVYKEDEYDRLCFEDMKTDKNCIDKNAVFTVNTDSHNRMFFTVYDGTYLLKKNGDIVKYEYK